MRLIAIMLAAGLLPPVLALAGEKAAAATVTLVEPTFSVANGRPQLQFKVAVTGGTLLDAELLRLGITSWQDDKGTDLGTKDPKDFYGDVTPMSLGSGDDFTVQLNGKTKPAEGAKTMSIDGTIPFKIGMDLREGIAKGVTLKVGGAFDIGPYTFRIAEIEPTRDLLGSDISDAQRIGFTFNSPVQLKDFSFLKEFTFLDAGGKEHPSTMKNFMGSFKDGGEHKLSVAVLPAKGPLDVRWAVYGTIVQVTVSLKHTGPVAAPPK